MMKKMIFILIGLLYAQGCTTMADPWKSAESKSTGRFIPIELWSGEKWNGNKELKMTPAEFRFGKRKHKVITGPSQWQHPITKQQMLVYERTNNTTKGTKRQLFTLNPDGSGLAKVFDHRPGRKDRFQSVNAAIFPVGFWKKGERREYRFFEFMNGKKQSRTATIRMRRLSFTYKGVEHAMKYDWILRNEKGQILFHERYIYGPGKSLMYYKNRLKKKKV